MVSTWEMGTPAARTEKETHPLRVLVVEDNRECADSLMAWLGMLGHEAKVAPDGPAALREARVCRPDVVLLDIGLPDGMTGLEVAERLRQQEAERTPLLIAVTGNGQDEDRRRSEEAGIYLHLVKPVDPQLLERVLERFRGIVLPD